MPQPRQLCLAGPPDPLTRLMMNADRVTEADINALLKRIIGVRIGS